MDETLPRFFLQQRQLHETPGFQSRLNEIGQKITAARGKKKKIFISFAPPENDDRYAENWTIFFTRTLAEDLRCLGFDIHVDFEELGSHRALQTHLAEPVRNADHIVIIVTQTFLAKVNNPTFSVAAERTIIEDRLKSSGMETAHTERLVGGLILCETLSNFPLLEGSAGFASLYLREGHYIETLCQLPLKLYELYRPEYKELNNTVLDLRRDILKGQPPTLSEQAIDQFFQRTQFSYPKGKITWSVRLRKNNHFISRGNILEDVQSQLSHYSTHFKSPTLMGEPGTGKTQLALACTYAMTEKGYYTHVAWIKCKNINSTFKSFRRFAEKMNMDVPGLLDKFLIKKVYVKLDQLKTNNARILLIFDDVPSEKELTPYLPPDPRNYPHVHILITSRNPLWSDDRTLIPVPHFTPDESQNYIRTALAVSQQEKWDLDRQAQKLATLCDHSPQALANAISHIKKENRSLASYVEMLESEGTSQSSKLPRFFLEQHALSKIERFRKNLTSLGKKLLTPGEKPKIIFISYAWPFKDDIDKERWTKTFVITLSENLRAFGCTLILDEVELSFGNVLGIAMQQSVTSADRIFIIVGETYRKKVQTPGFGAHTEYSFIQEQLRALFPPGTPIPPIVTPVALYEEIEAFANSEWNGGFPTLYMGKMSYIRGFCELLVHAYPEKENSLRKEFEHLQQLFLLGYQPTAGAPAVFPQTQATFFELLRKNEHFVGRKTQLAQLREELYRHSITSIIPMPPLPQAIAGTGGIGKTQLANAYAHEMKEQGAYPLIAWITLGGQSGSLSQSFLRFASETLQLHCQDVPEEKIIQAVYARLAEYKSQNAVVLLVFDDVNNEADLNRHLPADRSDLDHIHIIVTSRNHHWSDEHHKIYLENFSLEECLEYIREVLRETLLWDEAAARQLSLLVHRFPLALSQAVAYIKQTQCTIRDYNKEFETFPKNLLSQRSQQHLSRTPYEESVFTTWLISIKTIFSKYEIEASYVLAVLFLCSYCASEGISRELLAKFVPDLYLQTVIDILTQYSLLEPSETPGIFHIHQMLQDIIRILITSEETLESSASMEVEKFQAFSLLPQDESAEIVQLPLQSVWPFTIAWLLRTEFDPNCYAQGNVPAVMALQKKHVAHLHHALEYISPQQIFPSHMAFLTQITTTMSGFLSSSANFSAADSVAQKCIDFYLALRNMSPELFDAHLYFYYLTLTMRGGILLRLGKLEESQRELENVLDIIENIFFTVDDAEGQTVLGVVLGLCYLFLATVHGQNNNYHKSLLVLEKAYAPLKQQYKKGTGVLAQWYGQKGMILTAIGAGEEAKPFLEKALPLIAQTYGEDHPSTITTKAQYAMHLASHGNPEEAEKMLTTLLPVFKKMYGKYDHQPFILKARYAYLIFQRGHVAEAKRILEKIIPLHAKMMGRTHAQVAISLAFLAEIYVAEKRYDAAIDLLQEALLTMTKTHGPSNSQVSTLRSQLANLYATAGNQTRSEQLRNEDQVYTGTVSVAEVRSTSQNETPARLVVTELTEDTPEAARRWLDAHLHLLLLPEYKNYAKLFDKPLHLLKIHLGETDPSVQLYEAQLCAALYEDAATTPSQQSLERARQVLTEQPHAEENIYLALFNVQECQTSDWEYSPHVLEVLQKAFYILDARLQKNDFRRATCELSLARMLGTQAGDLTLSRHYMNEALPILQSWVGENTPEMATYLIFKAMILGVERKFEEAKNILQNNITILRQFPTYRRLIFQCQYILGGILSLEEDYPAARVLLKEALDGMVSSDAPNETNLAVCQLQLGVVLFQLKMDPEHQNAERLIRESLKTLTDNTDAKNPQVATASTTLATILLSKERLLEAQRYFEEAQPVLLKHYGEDHPYTLENYVNYACLLLKKGRKMELHLAKFYFKKAMRQFEKIKPLSASQITQLASCYFRMGKLAFAQATAVDLTNLSTADLEYYRKKKAPILYWFKKAIDFLKENHCHHHPFLGLSCMYLGKVLCTEGDENTGERYIFEAIPIIHAHFPEGSAERQLLADILKPDDVLEAEVTGSHAETFEQEAVQHSNFQIGQNPAEFWKPVQPRASADALLAEYVANRQIWDNHQKIQCLNRVITLAPNNPVPHFYKAQCLHALNKNIEASDHVQLCLSLETDESKKGASYALAAKIHRALGEENTARTCESMEKKLRVKK